MESDLLLPSLAGVVVSVIFIIRWWQMTSHIKEIRDLLLKKQKEEQKSNVENKTETTPVSSKDAQVEEF